MKTIYFCRDQQRSASLHKDPYKAVYHLRQEPEPAAAAADAAATSVPAAPPKPFIKNHGKSKSFSFNFLPSYWFSAPAQSQQVEEVATEALVQHRALIEHENCSDDYFPPEPAVSDVITEDQPVKPGSVSLQEGSTTGSTKSVWLPPSDSSHVTSSMTSQTTRSSCLHKSVADLAGVEPLLSAGKCHKKQKSF